MSAPVLRTARLLLRGAGDDDVDALQEIWNHEDVRRYLFDGQAVTHQRTREVLDVYHHAGERGHALWVVSMHGDPKVIGCVGLLEAGLVAGFDPDLRGMVEVVAAFDPARWHNGYAHEALMEMLAYAFDALGFQVLAGVVDVPNTASDAMLRRAGFAAVRECDGPHHRMRTYRLTRDHFRQPPEGTTA